MNRRAFLISGASTVGLVACSSNTNAAALNAINIAISITNGFVIAEKGFAALPQFQSLLTPAMQTKISNAQGTGYLDLALALEKATLVAVNSSTPPTNTSVATNMQTVETDLNNVSANLSPILTMAAAADPALAPVVVILQDAILAMPLIEAFINPILNTSSSTASFRAKTLRITRLAKGLPDMTPEMALADLKTRLGS